MNDVSPDRTQNGDVHKTGCQLEHSQGNVKLSAQDSNVDGVAVLERVLIQVRQELWMTSWS